MNEKPFVHGLYSRDLAVTAAYNLLSDHDGGLEGEPASTVVEEIFQTGAEEFHHHCIVLPLRAKPMYFGNANYRSRGKYPRSQENAKCGPRILLADALHSKAPIYVT